MGTVLGGEPVKERAQKERVIGDCYPRTLYENRMMKSIKNCAKKRGGRDRKSNRGGEFKVRYMHVWNYHNETSLYNAYTLIKIK
jgi:hypothetical protein